LGYFRRLARRGSLDLSYLRFAIESLVTAYVIHGTERYLRFSKVIGTIYWGFYVGLLERALT
jgi:hypothetical protein